VTAVAFYPYRVSEAPSPHSRNEPNLGVTLGVLLIVEAALLAGNRRALLFGIAGVALIATTWHARG
jgi:hypothetical protein